MDLPVMPPLSPMLAKAVEGMPTAEGMRYEPKWDGFRTIVFRDGDEVELGSRNERPMTRYFPEVVEAIKRELPPRCVLDGEIVVAIDGKLDFDALGQRIHPAESRITRLAGATPASFIAFDLLALDDRSFVDAPLLERRAALEAALADAQAPIHLTPSTDDPAVAQHWFERFEGAGLDGVIAKPGDGRYVPDKRVQFKVKHKRTADAAVAGFRWHKDGAGVGSLLLGLYDADGDLHHVGVASSFTAKRRAELVEELAPYRDGALDDHPWGSWAEAQADAQAQGKVAGGASRWNAKKDLSWEPVRVELVAEISYERVDHGRLRHGARLVRWRPDKTPEQCRFDQLEEVAPVTLDEVLSPRSDGR